MVTYKLCSQEFDLYRSICDILNYKFIKKSLIIQRHCIFYDTEYHYLANAKDASVGIIKDVIGNDVYRYVFTHRLTSHLNKSLQCSFIPVQQYKILKHFDEIPLEEIPQILCNTELFSNISLPYLRPSEYLHPSELTIFTHYDAIVQKFYDDKLGYVEFIYTHSSMYDSPHSPPRNPPNSFVVLKFLNFETHRKYIYSVIDIIDDLLIGSGSIEHVCPSQPESMFWHKNNVNL